MNRGVASLSSERIYRSAAAHACSVLTGLMEYEISGWLHNNVVREVRISGTVGSCSRSRSCATSATAVGSVPANLLQVVPGLAGVCQPGEEHLYLPRWVSHVLWSNQTPDSSSFGTETRGGKSGRALRIHVLWERTSPHIFRHVEGGCRSKGGRAATRQEFAMTNIEQ